MTLHPSARMERASSNEFLSRRNGMYLAALAACMAACHGNPAGSGDALFLHDL